MDNITHTLIGISLGNAVAAKESERDRLAFVWTSALASNLADFDFLVPYLVGEGGKIGYLLHHRGHSHTLIFVPLMAAIAVFLAMKITKARPRSGLKLMGVALVAAMLHIVADSWNDYGVHPFWPFSNDWFYGDSIFIIEPTFLLAMLPFAIAATRVKWVRYFWISLFTLLLGLIWFGPMIGFNLIDWRIGVGLTLWAAIFSWAQFRRPHPEFALGGVALSLAIFFAGSMITKTDIQRQMSVQASREKVVHLARSPSPANPFCWRVITVSTGPEGEYISRMGAYSAAPALFEPRDCNYRMQLERTSRLSTPSIESTSRLEWIGEFRGDAAQLRALSRQSCDVAAMLRFVRVAYWQDAVFGDLRYDFQPGLGFAEIEAQPGGPPLNDCPTWIPGWTPPLEAILNSTKGK